MPKYSSRQKKDSKFAHDGYGYHEGHVMVNYTLYYCEWRRTLDVQCPGMGKFFRCTNRFILARQHNHDAVAGSVESQILLVFIFYLYIENIPIFRPNYTRMQKQEGTNLLEV
jgi:hypothetical protein